MPHIRWEIFPEATSQANIPIEVIIHKLKSAIVLPKFSSATLADNSLPTRLYIIFF